MSKLQDKKKFLTLSKKLDEEVARLGLQHRIWRPRVLELWREVGIRPGVRVIDIGAGPGFATADFAELVAPGGTKFGHRHLHCSLCATAWRYVRTRCVHCGSTDKVSFRQLAGTTYLRAECCESCQGYSKVFFLEGAKPVEALADRISSEKHELIKKAKDIGSAAVLIALINVPAVWLLVLFG